MTEIAIIVEFETLEGREEEFTTVIREHAKRTLEEEAGCLRFEVIKPVEADGTPVPNRVMVNELYADRAAVTAHEQSPRMPIVGATIAPLLKSRRLIYAEMIRAGERPL
ncbi:putative quinol monooxygenase [Microvirga sp. 2TAF3]|uniref:putative quinol monooxygenase n=1 Tax=Microvirga sp. 2TAF3 TaxID=3233014 RepID=UPI003F9CEC33